MGGGGSTKNKRTFTLLVDRIPWLLSVIVSVQRTRSPQSAASTLLLQAYPHHYPTPTTSKTKKFVSKAIIVASHLTILYNNKHQKRRHSLREAQKQDPEGVSAAGYGPPHI